MEKNPRIIVIDDEPGVLESFSMILKMKDYEVDTFEDGYSAISAFKKDKYDIAFIDIIIPVEKDGPKDKYGGIKILKKLKEIDPDVEATIVTAYATEKTHSEAITLGALDYLRKPFLMEEIYELVERGLRRRKSKKHSL